MVKKFRILSFFLIFIFLINCSFDNKTGIWNCEKNEKRRVTDIEKQQKSIIDTVKLYSSENKYTKEIQGKNKVNFTTGVSINNLSLKFSAAFLRPDNPIS